MGKEKFIVNAFKNKILLVDFRKGIPSEEEWVPGIFDC